MAVRTDKLVLANLKNRTGQNELRSEINHLELAKKSDIRMIQNKKRKFRSKLLKIEENPPPSRDKETWNVRMYETHNPGFCYHRTGECRTSENNPKRTSSETHAALRDMFVSNGEVDIHKILCLHLLAAHRIFPLERTQSKVLAWRPFSPEKIMLPEPVYGPYFSEQPSKDRRDKELTSTESLMKKKKSPHQEKEKKKKSRLLEVKKLLPTYILELKESDNEDGDGDSDEEVELTTTDLETATSKSNTRKISSPKRVNKRDLEYIPIVINNEIESLIGSVIQVLLEVNAKKVRDLVALAKNPASIRQIMCKPEMHDFLDSLHGKPFVCNSESFETSNAYLLPMIERNIRKKLNIEEFIPFAFRQRTGGEMLALMLTMKDNSFTSSLDRLVGQIRNNVRHVKSVSKFTGPVPPNFSVGNQNLSTEKWLNPNTSTFHSSARAPGTYNIKPSPLTSQKVSRKRISRMALTAVTNILNRNAANPKNKRRRTRLAAKEKENTADLYKDKPKTESRFSIRKSTCPACIERLNFAQNIPKHNYAKSTIKFPTMSSQHSSHIATRFMTSKGIEEMVGVVSMYGSPQASYQVSSEETDKYGISRKSSNDASYKDNSNQTVLSFILRRLSNSQRILLGRKAAHLKTRSINMEGTEGKTRPPLTHLFDSILSKNSILELAACLKSKDTQLNSNAVTGFAKLLELERRGHYNEDRPPEVSSQNLDRNALTKNYSSRISLPTEKTIKVNLERLKYEIADQEITSRITDFLNSTNP